MTEGNRRKALHVNKWKGRQSEKASVFHVNSKVGKRQTEGKPRVVNRSERYQMRVFHVNRPKRPCASSSTGRKAQTEGPPSTVRPPEGKSAFSTSTVMERTEAKKAPRVSTSTGRKVQTEGKAPRVSSPRPERQTERPRAISTSTGRKGHRREKAPRAFHVTSAGRQTEGGKYPRVSMSTGRKG